MSNTSASSTGPAAVQCGVPMAVAVTSIRELLAFNLGAEEYGIDILRVQEIRSYEQPTRMANVPAFVKGVINLRGVIVPNIGTQLVGMVVDGVSDVITLTSEQLRPVPELSYSIGSEHLLAVGSVAGRMLILLNIGKLMTSTEMGLVAGTKH